MPYAVKKKMHAKVPTLPYVSRMRTSIFILDLSLALVYTLFAWFSLAQENATESTLHR